MPLIRYRTMVMDKRTQITTFTRNWFIAASSVIIARSLTAPAERVKIILQTQAMSPHIHELGVQPYTSFWDAVVRIRREHGMMGYWRGNGVNLMRTLPSSSFTFAFNDLFKTHVIGENEEQMAFWPRLGMHMLCGALAGVATMTIMQPVALCQTLVTADLNDVFSRREFSGLTSCLRSVYSKGGIRAYYTGFLFGILGMSTYRSLYFGMFATCKHYVENYYGGRAPFIIVWPMAQVVTLIASLINYPFDTISRGQQISLLSSETLQIRGPLDVAKSIYHSHGLRGIYRGVGANALRTFGGSLIIVAYDEIQFRFFTPEEKKMKTLDSMNQHDMEDTIWKTWET